MENGNFDNYIKHQIEYPVTGITALTSVWCYCPCFVHPQQFFFLKPQTIFVLIKRKTRYVEIKMMHIYLCLLFKERRRNI